MNKRVKNSFFITVIAMVIVQAISKILGFVREMLLARCFGASHIVDAFVIAQTVPSVIFGGLYGALGVAFVPMYSKICAEKGEDEAELYTSNLINIGVVISIAISLLGIIFSKQITIAFASGFSGETLKLSDNFLKITFAAPIFILVRIIQSSYMQSKRMFIRREFTNIILNIIFTITVLLAYWFNCYWLAGGFVLANFAGFVVQLVMMKWKSSNFIYKPIVDFKNEWVKKTMLLSIPVFIGCTTNIINQFVDKTLASRLPEGSISSLHYSAQLNDFAYVIIAASAASLIFPILSDHAANNDMENYKNKLEKAISAAFLLLIPITVGTFILSEPAVAFVYEGGNFDHVATMKTAQTLAMYSIGIVAIGIRDILIRAFYSMHDTRTPLINSFVSIAANIILNLILIRTMAERGLALASSIAAIISSGILICNLYRKVKFKNIRNNLSIGLKSGIAAALMGAFIYILYPYTLRILRFVRYAQGFSILVCIILGMVLYGAVITLLKVKLTDYISKKEQ